jgi:hypothetical protein
MIPLLVGIGLLLQQSLWHFLFRSQEPPDKVFRLVFC